MLGQLLMMGTDALLTCQQCTVIIDIRALYFIDMECDHVDHCQAQFLEKITLVQIKR